MPVFPVHYQLLELVQTHVHWVRMPSNHPILCHPLLLLPSIFPSIRVLSNESVLHIRWPKYWSFSSSISPSKEYSGLISFRIDWFDLLAMQGILKSLLQHHSAKASVFWQSSFFNYKQFICHFAIFCFHRCTLKMLLKKYHDIIFLHGPFFMVFIEFVKIFPLFYALFFWPWGMWDLSSPNRDRTHTPCIGRWSLNHWTTREVPLPWYFWSWSYLNYISRPSSLYRESSPQE